MRSVRTQMSVWDIFDQVANVDLSVRVRQRGRDENLAAGRLRACGEIGGGC